MATVNRPANVCTSQWFILHPQQHNKNFSSPPHNLLPHSPTVIKKLFKTFPQDLNFAFKMGSRQISIRRATSAGYRMPDRTATKITSVSSVSLSKTHPGTRQIPSDREKEKQQTWGDAVRKDHVWREFVEAERRGEKLWHENWSFLKEYDSLGNKKEVETLPDNVPIFSDQVPNTTNQNIGSRIDTDLGKTLVYMDFLLTSGNQKKKLGADLQPC